MKNETEVREALNALELTTAAVDRGDVEASDVRRAYLDGAVHALSDVLDSLVRKLRP